jgi:Zn finger protein HypA/HybF involved in hydrogenase expression
MPGLRLADVPAAYRERLVYPRRLEDVPADEVVQLNCEYCHVPDSAAEPPAPRSGASVPASGAYMQPINFERHCAACHSGELTAQLGDALPIAARQIPHGASPEQIRAMLTGLAGPTTGAPQLSPARPLVPIPGRTPGENLAQSTQLDKATQIASAAAFSMSVARCGKCHVYADQGGELPWPVVPLGLPSVWLEHARFDHAAHRALACFECHDRERLISADTEGKPPLDDPTPIIDDVEKCQQCHAPRSQFRTAGARHDCAECHRYHGGGRGPHGRGDPRRGVPSDDRHDARAWMQPRP